MSDRRCAVFVVQWLETFDVVAPLVRALREVGWETPIVLTPERSAVHANADGTYDLGRLGPMREILSARGFAPEPLLPAEAEADRIRTLSPSAVFLPTPYVVHRHESLAPAHLRLPVHYVNYGLNLSPLPELTFNLPFFRRCAAIYAENEYCAEQYVLAGVDASRVVPTGHPRLDHWDTEHPRSRRPTVLWCPWWSTRWTDGKVGYSTFLPSYRTVLAEARRRPHMQFIVRTHPYLWAELRSERLWTEAEERAFLAAVDELENVELVGNVNTTTTYPLYPSHVHQFEQAWAMVTDGISFLGEFGYTGKPILLTEAPGNPGWNPVGQAIRAVVQRCDGIQGLPVFLDRVEKGVDAEAERRQGEAIRRLFYRPAGGSNHAIVRHLCRVGGVPVEMGGPHAQP
jgi:hypothetical protein